MTHAPELTGADNAAIAHRLREELARRRISRQALADLARVSLSTLEKALSGSRPFSLATLVRIEDVLGTSLRGESASAPVPPEAAAMLAPPAMGSYSRPAVRWIEGAYLTLRPAFSQPGAIFAYRTEIYWDEGGGHLAFAESEREDSAFTQAGFVAMPNLSGHTYLVTSEEGQYRLIMLGRATREGHLYGQLSTLHAGLGSQLMPVACPTALLPIRPEHPVRFGVVTPDEGAFASYRQVLDRATQDGFCRWYA
ncbi:helix-turn-helix transcriptional regulator [Novosphingobium profundi]|uniref:helix-turn-helix domain-containing protein n=1 Tax=Novosphingobium profundi TaxID=1774954 RepID=UPI001BDAF437|nr:helix-turn-helix transcriptional regulator [Novosphingobium profundi]MBT0670976.1 helix-turn-helix transcriptional regulator [Novosphingobium profundi]